jgi:prepilin-type N-terminal cleavage/methylation domain-containing protein
MMKNAKGFTIVELLIVIVVIGVLAAITIVAYNGIQSRAKSSAAFSLAQNVRKAAELNLADSGTYPTITQMTSSSALAKFDANSFTVSAATPTTEKHVRYVQCGSPVIGAQITYRTFPTGTADIVLGTCS